MFRLHFVQTLSKLPFHSCFCLFCFLSQPFGPPRFASPLEEFIRRLSSPLICACPELEIVKMLLFRLFFLGYSKKNHLFLRKNSIRSREKKHVPYFSSMIIIRIFKEAKIVAAKRWWMEPLEKWNFFLPKRILVFAHKKWKRGREQTRKFWRRKVFPCSGVWATSKGEKVCFECVYEAETKAERKINDFLWFVLF